MTGERPDSFGVGEASSAEAFRDFTARLALNSIDLVRVSGERRAPGIAPETQYDLNAAWQVTDGLILWRYDVAAHLTDSNGTDYGTIDVAVVVSARSDVEPDGACIEHFGATSGAMMAHPYLREAVASTALRLGFTGVLMPLLFRGQLVEDGQD